ncbi:hypothetical protein [Streptomyces globisporus]|uniref:hypothetical protein n=1 Tax=Streptomyces globisporus TaxID=1908 RepID=UPI00068FA7BD|nr:hypothetical protein [Streptomyces globisporus]
MRTALRTAIATALVAGVAITAPALAAGAAFAADGPVAATPAATGAEADTKAGAEGTADAAQGTLVRTETLLNGTVARIYKVKDLHHRAELSYQGNPVGVLDATTRPVAGNDNGEFFVLFEDGRTLNWDRNYVPGARPGTYELADGTLLELARKDGRYGLQLIENGKGRGFTYLNGSRQVWLYGDAVVVLEQDGGFAAYIPGAPKQAAPKLVETPGTTPAPAPKPTPGPVVTLGDCTVQQVIPSVFGEGWEVTLTHDLEKGPKAVLKDDQGKVQGTADRAHPFDGRIGLKIEGADTLTPRVGQRTQGGDTPFRWTAFPKLPKGCEKDTATPTPAPSATTPAPAGNTGTTTDNGQTSVIPKGGVAAGAEFAAGGDSTALIAAGAGAASLAAGGLGFVVLRRRAAGTRG